MRLWRAAITELPLLVLTSFVDAAREGIYLSKTVDQRFVQEGLDVLVPVPHPLPY